MSFGVQSTPRSRWDASTGNISADSRPWVRSRRASRNFRRRSREEVYTKRRSFTSDATKPRLRKQQQRQQQLPQGHLYRLSQKQVRHKRLTAVLLHQSSLSCSVSSFAVKLSAPLSPEPHILCQFCDRCSQVLCLICRSYQAACQGETCRGARCG